MLVSYWPTLNKIGTTGYIELNSFNVGKSSAKLDQQALYVEAMFIGPILKTTLGQWLMFAGDCTSE